MVEAREKFIEEVGLAAEADGLPRIAGRLFGHLLLSPDPCTLDEIAEALSVSKGSVSTDARLLLRHGWLRRTSRAGDRKDYYEMAPDFFAGIVAYRLEEMGRAARSCRGVDSRLRGGAGERSRPVGISGRGAGILRCRNAATAAGVAGAQ